MLYLENIVLKDKPDKLLPAWIIEEERKRKKKEQEKREMPQLPLYLPELPDYKK